MQDDLFSQMFGGGTDATPESYRLKLALVGFDGANADANNQRLPAWMRAQAIAFMAGTAKNWKTK